MGTVTLAPGATVRASLVDLTMFLLDCVAAFARWAGRWP
jgi:hypothetical protein